METSLSSCNDASSPITETGTKTGESSACSPISPPGILTACCAAGGGGGGNALLMCPTHLMYDQHSSEEELEVINGPSAALKPGSRSRDTASSSMVSTRGCSSSLDGAEQHYYEADSNDGSGTAEEMASGAAGANCSSTGTGGAGKRSSSTLNENRKRSLAHSSDDELRNFIEPILTPVNFRTSPPLEAFKPNRSHMFRSTTPLILSEARCGIENMKLCDSSSIRSEDEAANGDMSNGGGVKYASGGHDANSESASGIIKMKSSNSSHHIYQPQPKYSFHYNSSRSSPASTTGLDKELRSVSPPAKLFHCAISPRRRPMRSAQQQHAGHRLQRPHRPCLDFDKMQQVSL